MFSVRFRENGGQLFRRGEMHWIVQPRIRTHASLETSATAVNLAEELNLQPPLVPLNSVTRLQSPRKLSDADEFHRRDQVHEPLRNTHQ